MNYGLQTQWLGGGTIPIMAGYTIAIVCNNKYPEKTNFYNYVYFESVMLNCIGILIELLQFWFCFVLNNVIYCSYQLLSYNKRVKNNHLHLIDFQFRNNSIFLYNVLVII